MFGDNTICHHLLIADGNGTSAVLEYHETPLFFQKVNKYEVPSNLMILQAIVISLLSTGFLLIGGSVNIAFWISVNDLCH